MLVSDLLARFGADITSTAHDNVYAAIWLCLFLVLLVLPLGVAYGTAGSSGGKELHASTDNKVNTVEKQGISSTPGSVRSCVHD